MTLEVIHNILFVFVCFFLIWAFNKISFLPKEYKDTKK